MDKAALAKKVAGLLGVSSSERDLAFNILVEKITEILSRDEALRVPDLGYFQIKHKPMKFVEKIIEDDLGAESYDTLLFSPMTGIDEHDDNLMFLTFDIPSISADSGKVDENVFDIGFGKPILPLAEESNQNDSDTSYLLLKKSIEERVLELLSNCDKLENFDLWEDYLNSISDKSEPEKADSSVLDSLNKDDEIITDDNDSDISDVLNTTIGHNFVIEEDDEESEKIPDENSDVDELLKIMAEENLESENDDLTDISSSEKNIPDVSETSEVKDDYYMPFLDDPDFQDDEHINDISKIKDDLMNVSDDPDKKSGLFNEIKFFEEDELKSEDTNVLDINDLLGDENDTLEENESEVEDTGVLDISDLSDDEKDTLAENELEVEDTGVLDISNSLNDVKDTLAENELEVEDTGVLGISNSLNDVKDTLAENELEVKDTGVLDISVLSDDEKDTLADNELEVEDKNVLDINDLSDDEKDTLAENELEVEDTGVLDISDLSDGVKDTLEENESEVEDTGILDISVLSDDIKDALEKNELEIESSGVFDNNDLLDDEKDILEKRELDINTKNFFDDDELKENTKDILDDDEDVLKVDASVTFIGKESAPEDDIEEFVFSFGEDDFKTSSEDYMSDDKNKNDLEWDFEELNDDDQDKIPEVPEHIEDDSDIFRQLGESMSDDDLAEKKTTAEDIPLTIDSDSLFDESDQEDINEEAELKSEDTSGITLDLSSEDEEPVYKNKRVSRTLSGSENPGKGKLIWGIAAASVVIAFIVIYFFTGNSSSVDSNTGGEQVLLDSTNQSDSSQLVTVTRGETPGTENISTPPSTREQVPDNNVKSNNQSEPLVREFPNEKSVSNLIFFNGTDYYVQVSSHSTLEKATREANRLRAMGHNAFIMKAWIDKFNSYWYRVKIGFFKSQAEAKKFQSNNKF